MKIAVTGSGGMLGHDIQRAFSEMDVVALTRNEVDITDLGNCLSIIKNVKPDYLIHAAAFTDVDGSERDPDTAILINGIGTRNITMACEEVRCPVIYISSDYVFDGTKGAPYQEWDETNPLSRYGLSKLIGERFVRSLTNRFYIVRTSWLFGENGRNFVNTMIRLLSERDEIEVVDDQRGCPTYTSDLALKLKELIGMGYGIYHITNSAECSWYEFALEIAKRVSGRGKIKATTSDRFVRPARRPSYSVLDNTMLRLEGLQVLRSWDEALSSYISRIS